MESGKPRHTGVKKWLRIGAGSGLVLIGIVGLALPILPGWALIIPGLVILGEHYEPAQKLVDWGKERLEKHTGRKWGSAGADSEHQPDDSATGQA